MPDSRAVALVFSTALACACTAAPRTPSSSPPRQTAHEAAGQRYLLHLPAAYESRSDWPVILFLIIIFIRYVIALYILPNVL